MDALGVLGLPSHGGLPQIDVPSTPRDLPKPPPNIHDITCVHPEAYGLADYHDVLVETGVLTNHPGLIPVADDPLRQVTSPNSAAARSKDTSRVSPQHSWPGIVWRSSRIELMA